MDDKTKLYIFARTEIALIFLFVLVIAATSFVLGVKVGRSYSYESAGFSGEDQRQVEFLSGEEESVNQIVEEYQEGETSKADDFNKRLEEKIKAELSKEPQKKKPVTDDYTGKYTIQLVSHRSLQEAKVFAEGFKVRGYHPIVNEVELPDRGIWYRVSLGVFDTVDQAKQYVEKERFLFQGQDHVFVRFD